MKLVIGDIHGNREALDLVLSFYDAVQKYSTMKREIVEEGRVFSKIDIEIMEDLHSEDILGSSESISEIVVLGDVINRGDDSAYCIDKLIEKDKEGLIKTSIRGNHEDIVLGAYELVDEGVKNLDGILKTSMDISKELAIASIDTVRQLFEGVPKKRLEEIDKKFSSFYGILKEKDLLKTISAKMPNKRRILEDMEKNERSFWFYDIVKNLLPSLSDKEEPISDKEFRTFRRYAFIMKQKDCVDEEVKYGDKEVKIRWSHGAPLHFVEEVEHPNKIYVYPASSKKEGRKKCDDYALELYREGIDQAWLAHTHVQSTAIVKIGVWDGEPMLYSAKVRREMKGKKFDGMHEVEFYKPGSVGNARDVPGKISFAIIKEEKGDVKAIRIPYDSKSINSWTLE